MRNLISVISVFFVDFVPTTKAITNVSITVQEKTPEYCEIVQREEFLIVQVEFRILRKRDLKRNIATLKA